MILNELALAQKLESEFEMTMRVAVSNEPIAVERLTAKEMVRFDELEASPRCVSWLKGRSALKRLLAHLGESEETSDIAFPNPRFSLTHAGDTAIAVGTPAASLLGIGVDLEMNRIARPETARLFLTERELYWLTGLDETARSKCLLRLWTIKEALFKSDPLNDKRWFSDYAIEAPGELSGVASVDEPAHRFRYCCFELEDGFLSAAVLTGRHTDAQ